MLRYRHRDRSRGRGGSGATSPFTPASLSGLSAWYDPSDSATITQSSGLVSALADKSGNGNNATSSGAQRPTTGAANINSLNALSFTGTHVLTLPSGLYNIPNSAYTIFATFLSNTNTGQFLIRGLAGASNFYALINDSADTQISISSGSGATQIMFRKKDSAQHVLVMTKDSSTALTLGLDNAAEYNISNSGNVSLTAFGIGGVNTSGSFNGLIGEILIYNRQLLESEISSVQNYLFTKWAVGPANLAPQNTPLRIASVQNRVCIDGFTLPSANRVANRVPHRLGHDMKNFVLSFNNFWMTSIGDAANTNTMTILDCSIESCYGTVIPVTFGGNRSITLSGGAADVHSDTISSASFGRTKFPRGSTWWIKYRLSVPSIGNIIPVSVTGRTAYATTQMAVYVDANTTVSDTDLKGPYTVVSGSALVNIASTNTPFLIGNPVTDTPSWQAIGDSIVEGLGDNGSSNLYGVGFVQRSTHDAAFTDPIPMLNLAKGGAITTAYTSSTRINQIIAAGYARFTLEELGTNDLNTESDPSVILSRLTPIWSACRSGGAQKVFRTKYLPGCTSTDSFQTTLNQTPRTNWGIGQTRDQLNSAFDALVVATTLDGAFSIPSVADTVEPNKWVVSGTSNYATADGTHPGAVGAEFAAADLRPSIRAIL